MCWSLNLNIKTNYCTLSMCMVIQLEKIPSFMVQNTQLLIYNIRNVGSCPKYFHKRQMFFDIILASINWWAQSNIQLVVISIQVVLEHIHIKHQYTVIGISKKGWINHSHEKLWKNLDKVWSKALLIMWECKQFLQNN